MKRGLLALTAAAFLLPMTSADAQWVFVARKAAQRIHHMSEGGVGGQPGYDFASVVLEAPADKVFGIAHERAKQNRQVRILMADPVARRMQIAHDDRTATLNVVELSEGVSQLLIAGRSKPNEPAASSEIVAAVMRICAEMGKTCELSK